LQVTTTTPTPDASGVPRLLGDSGAARLSAAPDSHRILANLARGGNSVPTLVQRLPQRGAHAWRALGLSMVVALTATLIWLLSGSGAALAPPQRDLPVTVVTRAGPAATTPTPMPQPTPAQAQAQAGKAAAGGPARSSPATIVDEVVPTPAVTAQTTPAAAVGIPARTAPAALRSSRAAQPDVVAVSRASASNTAKPAVASAHTASRRSASRPADTARLARPAAVHRAGSPAHSRQPGRASAAGPPQPADSDVALLAAIVAHASNQPPPPLPERVAASVRVTASGVSDDVVQRTGNEATASLLQRCQQLGFIEAMLCRARICSGRRDSDAACR
jgi:hypothetical protein